MDLLCCASLSQSLSCLPRHVAVRRCQETKQDSSWNKGQPLTQPTRPVKKSWIPLPPRRHRRCPLSATSVSLKTAATVSPEDPHKKQTVQERTFLGTPCGGWGESLTPEVKERLRLAVVKYGEFAQMTYDGMISKNLTDPRYGNAWATEDRFMDRLPRRIPLEGETADGEFTIQTPRHTFVNNQDEDYEVRAFLNASAGAYTVLQGSGSTRNFMGFVAERKADKGPADEIEVVVAWRGTITKDEWLQNAKAPLVAWNEGFQVAEPPPALERSSFPSFKLGESSALAFVTLASTYIYKAATTDLLAVLEQWASSGILQEKLLEVLPSLLYDAAVLVASISAVLVAAQLLVRWVKARRDGVPEMSDADFFGGWLVFGLRSWWRTQTRGPRTPGVHYGFKQTYTEAASAADKGEEGRPGPPRLTVFRQLNRILEANKGKKKVRIVTVGHSLGGALARLCAFDLHDVARRGDVAAFDDVYEAFRDRRVNPSPKEVDPETETVDGFLASLEKAPSSLTEKRTRVYRHSYMRLIANEVRKFWENIGEREVTINCVSFAAPRVGDNNFAARFEPGSHSATREPWKADLWDIIYMLPPLLLGWLFLGKSEGVAITSVVANFLSSAVGGVLVTLFAATVAVRGYSTLKAGLSGLGKQPPSPPARASSCTLSCVSVVNAGDKVPEVPWGFISMERYWHCGYELLVNALEDASYFKGHPVKLFNTALGQLPSPLIWFNVEAMGDFHNLEVYLKACDDRRDVALMNKSSGAVDNEKILLITNKLDAARAQVLAALEYLLGLKVAIAKNGAALHEDGAAVVEGSGDGEGTFSALEEPSEPGNARIEWIMSALERIVEEQAQAAVKKERKNKYDDDSRVYCVALQLVKKGLGTLMEEQARRRNAAHARATGMSLRKAFDKLLDEPQKELAKIQEELAKHPEAWDPEQGVDSDKALKPLLRKIAELEDVLIEAKARADQQKLRVVLKTWFQPEINSGLVEKEKRKGVYMYK